MISITLLVSGCSGTQLMQESLNNKDISLDQVVSEYDYKIPSEKDNVTLEQLERKHTQKAKSALNFALFTTEVTAAFYSGELSTHEYSLFIQKHSSEEFQNELPNDNELLFRTIQNKLERVNYSIQSYRLSPYQPLNNNSMNFYQVIENNMGNTEVYRIEVTTPEDEFKISDFNRVDDDEARKVFANEKYISNS